MGLKRTAERFKPQNGSLNKFSMGAQTNPWSAAHTELLDQLLPPLRVMKWLLELKQASSERIP